MRGQQILMTLKALVCFSSMLSDSSYVSPLISCSRKKVPTKQRKGVVPQNSNFAVPLRCDWVQHVKYDDLDARESIPNINTLFLEVDKGQERFKQKVLLRHSVRIIFRSQYKHRAEVRALPTS